MKIRVTFFVLFTVILVGCATTPVTGRVVGGNGIVYSEYYENITYLESPKLKVHAIETLGKERLPEKYTLSEFNEKFLKTPDTIETVFEVYITNNSDETVHVSLGRFRSGGRRGSFNGEQYTIEPGRYVKSNPIVGVTSVYKAVKGSYELELQVNGKDSSLSGEINRLRVDQLRR